MVYCKKVGDLLVRRRWTGCINAKYLRQLFQEKGPCMVLNVAELKRWYQIIWTMSKEFLINATNMAAYPIHLGDIIEDELWQG